MNPRTETIPGLRQPTAREQARIAESWCPEIQRIHSPNAGKLLRFVGIFLICFGTVSAMRGGEGIVGTLILLIAAVACLVFSGIGRSSARMYRNRLNALKSGNYQVAPAVSTKVMGSESGNAPGGLVKAGLPGGEPLSGSFPIPYVCAEPLIRQKIHAVPLLLIRIPGDPDILAIPVE